MHVTQLKGRGSKTIRVRIEYETGSECSAAQGMQPAQTLGKKHPFLFTQCQAIHARSLVPCQDSPFLKITYSARVKVMKPLVVVMSALKEESEESSDSSSLDHRIFSFRQGTRIPSYLIALAAGNLACKEIGPQSSVYSEPEIASIENDGWMGEKYY